MDPERQLEALSDPTRRAVFALLCQGERSVGELAAALPVSRPAVSQHLRVLAEAGLASATRDGNRRIYRAEPAGLAAIRAWLDRQWDQVLDRFEDAARKERNMTHGTIPPVHKERTVPIPPETAFALFTERIGEWWPTSTHSIQGEGVAELRFEDRVGGRVIEVGDDGTEYAWADILAWDPPHRLKLSWHPNPDPLAASTLEVRFAPAAEGTSITLVHEGWEEFGADGPNLRSDYEAGWNIVLDPYLRAAAAHTPTT